MGLVIWFLVILHSVHCTYLNTGYQTKSSKIPFFILKPKIFIYHTIHGNGGEGDVSFPENSNSESASARIQSIPPVSTLTIGTLNSKMRVLAN